MDGEGMPEFAGGSGVCAGHREPMTSHALKSTGHGLLLQFPARHTPHRRPYVRRSDMRRFHAAQELRRDIEALAIRRREYRRLVAFKSVFIALFLRVYDVMDRLRLNKELNQIEKGKTV